MRILGMSALALLASCSDAAVSEASTDTIVERSFIVTESGRYHAELNSKLNLAALPANSDLKMLDGDLTTYAVKLCGLDFANKLRPERCEVFVQIDKSGLLTGYIALQEGTNVRIETALETDRQKGGLGCFLTGAIESSDYTIPDEDLDVSKDFKARLPFFAWEKNPGNWMVPSSSDGTGAGGMWYLERVNSKLRVSQERWNYCYSNPNISVDEVFTHAVTLARAK